VLSGEVFTWLQVLTKFLRDPSPVVLCVCAVFPHMLGSKASEGGGSLGLSLLHV